MATSERPLIVQFFELLLRLVVLLLTLLAVPSHLLLRVAAALAGQDGGAESRGLSHALHAVPRLLGLLLAPAALAGPIVAAEFAVKSVDLGWPVGPTAALAALVELYGLWAINRSKRVSKEWKIEPQVFCVALAQVLLDGAAIFAFVFILLTIVRVPTLCSQLRSGGADEDGRYVILENALWVGMDIFALPFLVILVLCPWRIWPTWEACMAKTEHGERWLAVMSNASAAIIDVPFVLVGLLSCLSPLQGYKLMTECRKALEGGGEVANELRCHAVSSFGLMLLDFACFFLACLLLLCPWRLVFALRDAPEAGWRHAVVFHLWFVLCDLITLVLFAVAACTWRSPRLPWPGCSNEKKADWRTTTKWDDCNDTAHVRVIYVFCAVLCDIVVCSVPVAIVTVTLYRLPAAVRGIYKHKADQGAYYVLWKQAGLVLIELPIMALSCLLFVAPWRFVWLVQDVFSSKDKNFRRLAVFHHVPRALADLLALLALLVLFITAPHRLFSTSFQLRLKTGARHIGKSANRQWLVRRPVPRVPEEDSKIYAYHGTSVEAAAKIEKGGFEPSKAGMLGRGVYVSRDPSKAENYGPQILRVEVTIGKVAVIEYQKHPIQQKWAEKGFDLAWVPAGCGMVPSNREEGCIINPANVKVIGSYERVHHPHMMCMREMFEGLVDVILIGPLLMLVLCFWRLPGLCKFYQEFRQSEAPNYWNLRGHVILQCIEALFDLPCGVIAVFLAIISPWRFFYACKDHKGNCSQLANLEPLCGEDAGWRCIVVYEFMLAVLDLVALALLPLVLLSGYRAWLLQKELAHLEPSVKSFKDYLKFPFCACAVIIEACSLVVDLVCMVLAVVTCCTWRCGTLIRGICRSRTAAAEDQTPQTTTQKPEESVKINAPGCSPAAEVVGVAGTSGSSADDQLSAVPRSPPSAAQQEATSKAQAESGASSCSCKTVSDMLFGEAGDVNGGPGPRTGAQGGARDASEGIENEDGSDIPSEGARNAPRVSSDIVCSGELAERLTPRQQGMETVDKMVDLEAGFGGKTSKVNPEDEKVEKDAVAKLRGFINTCRVEALRAFALVFIDLHAFLGLIVIAVLITRAVTFLKRAWEMLCVKAKVASDMEGGQSVTRLVGPPAAEVDAERGITNIMELEGVAVGHTVLSMTFFYEVIAAEAMQSVLNVPMLLLLPVLIFYPAVKGSYTYAKWRFEGKVGEALPKTPLNGLVLWLLAHCGDPTDGRCAQYEQFIIVNLLLLVVILFSELSTLVYYLLVFAVFAPLSLGAAWWPQSWKASVSGQNIQLACHNVQALVLPVVLAIFLLLPFAPTLWWTWGGEEGWLIETNPWGVRLPHAVVMPPWFFWIAQGALFIIVCGAYGVFVKTPRKEFSPSLLKGGLLTQFFAFLSGKAGIWKNVIDPVLGGVVRCSYRHRRTCGCLGEIVLTVVLPVVALWPLAVAAVCASGAALSAAVAWWVGAVIATLFCLFHTVRIGKAYWQA